MARTGIARRAIEAQKSDKIIREKKPLNEFNPVSGNIQAEDSEAIAKLKNPELSDNTIDNPEDSETPEKAKAEPESMTKTELKHWVKFMHMGKGRHVVKGFSSKEEATTYGKNVKPWMEGSTVKYPELASDPGFMEVVD